VRGDVRIEPRDPCDLARYRRLYRDVGRTWYWHERLKWTDQELESYLADPNVRVWELLVDGESAGYFELYRHAAGDVEIHYFGLMPQYIGRGLGGMLLERAVREAWNFGGTRVWLHTCTLDSPNALPGYQARGFRPFRTEKLEVDIDGTEVVAERLVHD